MLKRMLLTMGLACGLSAPAFAGWVEARSAHDASDHATVFREVAELARLGDALAQFDLGVMYMLGQGVMKNDEEADKWVRLSAYHGLAEAQFTMGIKLLVATMLFGGGTPEDRVEAERWFRLAAEQGLAEAQFELAELLMMGDMEQERSAEAISWYLKAAEQGFTLAQDALAEIYRTGRGHEANDIEALKWYLVASDECRAATVDARGNRGMRRERKRVQPSELSCLDLLNSALTPDQLSATLDLADQIARRLAGRKVDRLQLEVIFPETKLAP